MSLRKKIQTVQKLLDLKDKAIKKETLFLGNLQKKKHDKKMELQRHQETYLRSIDILNKLRTEGQVPPQAYEKGADDAKTSWAFAYQELARLENEILNQMAKVQELEKSFKTMETLKERLEKEQEKFILRKEQEIWDLMANRIKRV